MYLLDISCCSLYKLLVACVINFKKDNPAILALISLTKAEPKTGKLAGLRHEESIADYFRPVKITGSLVEKQTDMDVWQQILSLTALKTTMIIRISTNGIAGVA